MKIAYSSENKIYTVENGNKTEIPCGRIIKYKDAVDSIRRRNEWKTSGKGAAFMGMNVPADTENIAARICGLADFNGRLIYAAELDESSSLYHRSYDRTDEDEGLILSGNELYFGDFDYYNGKMCVSLGSVRDQLHIAVMEPPSSAYEEYTDGDSTEEFPWQSRYDNDRIYFTASGYARNEYGAISAQSPKSAAYLDTRTKEINEFISDKKYDFMKIKDDKFGNIYYIRQPYGGEKQEEKFKFSDVVLFPYRLLKGFFGWLNFMCTIWGGEPLKNGGSGVPGAEKTRQRTQRDLIIDGNVLNAKKLAKLSELKDDDMTGLLPLSRVLVKREADGNETVIAKSVLDYTVCADGKLIVSNGRHIFMLENGSQTHIAKAYLAVNLTECG